LGEAAAFLFDQIVFNAADGLGEFEQLFPTADTLAQQHAIFLLRVVRPILEVISLDASGVAFDEGERIGAGGEASGDVELKGDFLRRIGREDIDGARAVHGTKIDIPIVITAAEAGLLEFGHGFRQHVGRAPPAIEVLLRTGVGHDDVTAAQNVIEFDDVRKVLVGKMFGGGVVGVTAKTEVIEVLAHFLRAGGSPIEVRGPELDAFVAHLAQGLEGAHEIALLVVADGIHLDADWNLLASGVVGSERAKGQWRRSDSRQKRSARTPRPRASFHITNAGGCVSDAEYTRRKLGPCGPNSAVDVFAAQHTFALMKVLVVVAVLAAGVLGYFVGYKTGPERQRQLEDAKFRVSFGNQLYRRLEAGEQTAP
jgi:hypothetical protein